MFISLHQKHVPAQTVSQGNRSTHARESYRSTNVWQSHIITRSIENSSTQHDV